MWNKVCMYIMYLYPCHAFVGYECVFIQIVWSTTLLSNHNGGRHPWHSAMLKMTGCVKMAWLIGDVGFQWMGCWFFLCWSDYTLPFSGVIAVNWFRLSLNLSACVWVSFFKTIGIWTQRLCWFCCFFVMFFFLTGYKPEYTAGALWGVILHSGAHETG